MLGLIHRAVLGMGPPQFEKYFRRAGAPLHPHGRNIESRHTSQLSTFRKGKFLDIMGHSVLGLIDIYNLLPQSVIDAPTVKIFQRRLQDMLRNEAENGYNGWPRLFSPRNDLWNNRLVGWRTYMRNDATKNGTVTTTVNANERCASATCVNAWLRFAT